MGKIIVVAIGGNSIIRPGEKGTIQEQWDAADETCVHIAGLIKRGYQPVLTHGNGPQIGNILLRSELARNTLPTLPLDVCGADSQGAMGYMLQQLLDKELKKNGIFDHPTVTVITQVVIDRDDPGFNKPSKPIGPFYTRAEAEEHRIVDHWDIVEDANRGYRRVVPSPKPLRIVEEKAIKLLVDAGFVVIAVGGGGLPVMEMEDGSYRGTNAVIDKDHASALLASSINADILLISTAVEQVYINFGTERQQSLDTLTVEEALRYAAGGQFARGSMLPKIEAACDFVKRGGSEAIITSPDLLCGALTGNRGTHIVP